jgi:hypothetical protein
MNVQNLASLADVTMSACGVNISYTSNGKQANYAGPLQTTYTDGNLIGREYLQFLVMNIDKNAIETGTISFSSKARDVCKKHNFMMVEGAWNSGKDKIIFYFK